MCAMFDKFTEQGAPQDKWSANTQSLPNTISKYIDPRGALFGAPVLCFYTACIVGQFVIEHYTLDLALGTSREFAIW